MPTYEFVARDATGAEIRDIIEAPNEEEAHATIRQRGYYVTKLTQKKVSARDTTGRRRRSFAIGRVKRKVLTVFTRQLSILQDAGLPILRSLRILEEQARPGALKNALITVCEEIEGGATLSEAMAKAPKAFDRLYINMIKAGEAGGALEVILQRLADFLEKAESLKRKVRGAMVYPIVVIVVAILILTFIMMKIVPEFEKIFDEFDAELPAITQLLIDISNAMYEYWWAFLLSPVAIYLFVAISCSFRYGRLGWDLFKLKLPVFGKLIQKNIMARTTRTLGTLIASGVPILEALNITRETSNNLMYENMYAKVYESIREGESIAAPMKEYSKPPFHPITLFWFAFFLAGPVGMLIYMLRGRERVVDDIVVNMVDVGEETGELDTMLYKVADNYDEEVKVMTDTLTSLLEPIMICVLGGMVGFIVIALFMPLISLISKLSR